MVGHADHTCRRRGLRRLHGDGIESRILARTGAEVVDLGIADQWMDGAGHGCEMPADDRYGDVFANPANYIVEFRVSRTRAHPSQIP
jgi:hypothetical protein